MTFVGVMLLLNGLVWLNRPLHAMRAQDVAVPPADEAGVVVLPGRVDIRREVLVKPRAALLLGAGAVGVRTRRGVRWLVPRPGRPVTATWAPGAEFLALRLTDGDGHLSVLLSLRDTLAVDALLRRAGCSVDRPPTRDEVLRHRRRCAVAAAAVCLAGAALIALWRPGSTSRGVSPRDVEPHSTAR